jgi:hypothetical protein
MADISITAANVVPAVDASVIPIKLGANANAGQIVVYDAVNNNYILASNTTQALAGGTNPDSLVMVLASALNGQTTSGLRIGSNVSLGTVLTRGRWYVLSASGAISPENDATTSDWSTLIGYAVSTSILRFQPIVTGVQI